MLPPDKGVLVVRAIEFHGRGERGLRSGGWSAIRSYSASRTAAHRIAAQKQVRAGMCSHGLVAPCVFCSSLSPRTFVSSRGSFDAIPGCDQISMRCLASSSLGMPRLKIFRSKSGAPHTYLNELRAIRGSMPQCTTWQYAQR